MRIQRPTAIDAPSPVSVYNRKGFFALNMPAVVRAHFKLQFLSSGTAGWRHDSTASSACGLSAHLAADASLPDELWAAADDAYVACKRLLTPCPGRRLSWEKDSFNFCLSSCRIFVEQTFCQLVAQ